LHVTKDRLRQTRLKKIGERILRLPARAYYAFAPKVKDASSYIPYFAGKGGLEIGGPSAVFRDEKFRKFIPVYRHVRSLDGCNFDTSTVWEGSLREGESYEFLAGRKRGFQFILDGTDLGRIPPETYDFILSSHSLEHIANPVKALKEWIRVLKKEGTLLLILPHKDASFDHRRPVTELRHMIEDYERGTREDDLTHLPEILRLHDLEMDPPAGDLESFRQRSVDNLRNRCLHHHVFDLRTAMMLVDHVGLQILRAETAFPFHIIVLAARTTLPDNRAFLTPGSPVFARSRFKTDRRWTEP
jgi:SAM-dependent methyltransferase